MYRVHVAHTRLHLHSHFASEWYVARWTGSVKLKRNHREFLHGEEGEWLSREEILLVAERDARNWRNISLEMLVSVKTFPRAREHRTPSYALDRIPGVTCYQEKATFIRQLYVITRYRNP